MSLFGKTVYVGLSKKDAAALEEAVAAVIDRFKAAEGRIATLEQEVARLKKEPRLSLSQKLRAKGVA